MKDTRAFGTETEVRVVRAHYSKPSFRYPVSQVQVGDLKTSKLPLHCCYRGQAVGGSCTCKEMFVRLVICCFQVHQKV